MAKNQYNENTEPASENEPDQIINEPAAEELKEPKKSLGYLFRKLRASWKKKMH